jgi:hypothetical protein
VKHLIAFALVAGVALAQEDGDPKPGTLTAEEAEKTLTAAEVKKHIGTFASDEFGGRDTPSPGLTKAAEYIAAEFKRLGLKGVGDDGGHMKMWEYRGKKVPNCLGLLEGSDPKLKDEVVIVGGHMDHIGTQGREVMNGADDNASGTTGVLELAEAFASMKTPPKRSILFMTFSGEEKGLLGSRAYVNDPAIPLEKCVAMINLDMIGRSKDDYLFIGGLGTSEAFPEMVKKAAEGLDFKLETHPGGLAPSDNTNFHQKGLPVLFFFTHVHADYHGADDVVDKINAEAEAKILKMAFRIVREVGDRDQRPPFTRNNQQALPKDFNERMMERFGGGPAPRADRVRLGIQADEVDEGLKITELTEGGAAQKAGLKAGDVVTKLGDATVTDLADLRTALRKLKFGDTARVKVLRDGKELEVDVKFEK